MVHFCILLVYTMEGASYQASKQASHSCLFVFSGLADFWSLGQVITMVTPNRNYEF
jgi:hypothetical protein